MPKRPHGSAVALLPAALLALVACGSPCGPDGSACDHGSATAPSHSSFSQVSDGEKAPNKSEDLPHKPEHCQDLFAQPEAWQIRFDRSKVDDYMLYGLSAQRADVSPFLIRDKTGLYMRPSLNVQLSSQIPNECAFEGKLWLSTNEHCSASFQDLTKSKELPGSTWVGDERRWQLILDPHDKFLLMSGRPDTKYRDFSVKKLGIRIFFCVQPGPTGTKRPLHMVWYYQDPNNKAAQAVYEDTQILGLKRKLGWHVTFSEFSDRGRDSDSDMPAYSHMTRYLRVDGPAAAQAAQQWVEAGSPEESSSSSIFLRGGFCSFRLWSMGIALPMLATMRGMP